MTESTTEHDCDECAVYAEHDTAEAREAMLAYIRTVGLWAYIREMRVKLRVSYPYRKCARCWLAAMVFSVRETWHSPRRLAFHLVTEIGTRAAHPQHHSRWFGTCLDREIERLAEFVDREVAHTEMSCQGTDGDPKHPPYLMVTSLSWPALRSWLYGHDLTVSEVPWSVARARSSTVVDTDVVASPALDSGLTAVWLGVSPLELLSRRDEGE